MNGQLKLTEFLTQPEKHRYQLKAVCGHMTTIDLPAGLSDREVGTEIAMAETVKCSNCANAIHRSTGHYDEPLRRCAHGLLMSQHCADCAEQISPK